LKLAEQRETIEAARWSPSGDAVYYLHGTGNTNTLSKVWADRRKQQPKVLATGLLSGGFFSISSDGKRLIYTRLDSSSNLWRVKWRDGDNPIKPVISQLTTGTFSHAEPNYSPDGQWIAFRRGPDFNTANIFKMRAVGGPSTQLTFFDRGVAVSPAWSPDGQQIAFDREEQGVLAKIATVGATGGEVKILQGTNTSDASGYVAWWPSKEIVYQQSGNRNLLQIKHDTGEEIPILRNAERGWVADRFFLSPNGKKVAVYWNRPDAGLWIVSRDPYVETLLKPGLCFPIGWSPDARFVYAIQKPNGRQIVRIETANPQNEILVADLPGPTYGVDDAAVSPSGSEIVVSISEERSDVWSIENFDPEGARVRVRPD